MTGGDRDTTPVAPIVDELRRLGILIPVRMLTAAREHALPIPLAAAVLIQESGGGRNEWGHDPTIFAGGYDAFNHKQWGETITRDAYLEYRRQRRASGNREMQGVGPCQLTYWSYQDQADELGGCWEPLANMRVGFGLLADLIRRNGLQAGIAAYNGTGPPADRYAQTVLTRAHTFAGELGEHWPPTPAKETP